MTATLTTHLTVYDDNRPDAPLLETQDGARIAEELRAVGIRFERWETAPDLAPGASHDDVLAAYADAVQRLTDECGYTTIDVARIERGAPNAAQARQKFLDEHSHAEDEVRFFVEGRGAFYLHIGARVYRVVCVKGDLISVPAGTTHWFDMGEHPEFTAVRFFVNPDGWVGNFTGSSISSQFPKLD